MKYHYKFECKQGQVNRGLKVLSGNPVTDKNPRNLLTLLTPVILTTLTAPSNMYIMREI